MTLKTGVMMLSIQLCITGIIYIINIPVDCSYMYIFYNYMCKSNIVKYYNLKQQFSILLYFKI